MIQSNWRSREQWVSLAKTSMSLFTLEECQDRNSSKTGAMSQELKLTESMVIQEGIVCLFVCFMNQGYSVL